MISHTRCWRNSAGQTASFYKPRLPEAKICLWEDLTYSGMDLIEQATSVEQLRDALCLLLSDPVQDCDPRGTILLDLYSYALQFTRSHRFSKEKTSAFFSILRRVHKAATDTSLGNVDECFQYFNDLVFCHAVRRPPFSIDLYNAEEVKLITDYIVNTYFRHFKLYKYTFTPQIRMDLSLNYVGMPETPPGSAAEEVEPVLEEHKEEERPHQEEEPQAAPPPPVNLRQYIEGRVAEQVSELQASVERKLRTGEQELGARLSALERPGGLRVSPKPPRGKR